MLDEAVGIALLSPVRPCSPMGASGLLNKPPLSCSELKGCRGLLPGQMLIAFFLVNAICSCHLVRCGPTTQVSNAIQTMEMLQSFIKWWLKLSKMDEAARVSLHAVLGNQCTIFTMFFLNVLQTLFQKHSRWGKHATEVISTPKVMRN